MRRIQAIVVGVVLSAVVAAIAAAVFVAPSDRDGSRGDSPHGSNSQVTDGTSDAIPEGRLVVQLDSGIEVIAEGARWSISSGDERIVAYDVSPDGGTMVGASYVKGSYYQREYLLTIDVSSGQRTVLVRANAAQDLGPAVWSPDGTVVAFALYTLEADPSVVHPVDPVGESICLVDVATQTSRCSPDLGTVQGFSWSPDGQRIVFDGAGHELGLRLLDVATWHVSEPISPRDTELVDALGGAPPDSFVFAEWSSSGRFVATLAHPHVVAVFETDGRFLTLGHPTEEFSDDLSWSPASDVLVYAIGHPPYSITDVHVLDVEAGEDRLLLSTGNGEHAPIVSDLAWSPSGRWLAVVTTERSLYLPKTVRIVDVLGETPDTVIDLPPADWNDVLVGWVR